MFAIEIWIVQQLEKAMKLFDFIKEMVCLSIYLYEVMQKIVFTRIIPKILSRNVAEKSLKIGS